MSALNLTWQKMGLVGAMISLPFLVNGCGALFVSGASATASTQVTQDSRDFSTMIYDEGIEQKSYEILKSNTLLSNPENLSISITAFNSNVLITGQTINKDYLKWVVRQIEQLEHVRKVYNYATLQKPVSASVVSKDAYITSQVKARLLFGKDINSNRFKVVTENGNVFLMGIVTHDEAKRAINEALKIDGVRKVYHIFDYIEVQSYSVNGAQSEENLVVTPVKGNKADYQNPNQIQYRQPFQGIPQPVSQTVSQPMAQPVSQPVANPQMQQNSSYVPPVNQQQNGGAYIIEETPPAGYQGDLLAPAEPVY